MESMEYSKEIKRKCLSFAHIIEMDIVQFSFSAPATPENLEYFQKFFQEFMAEKGKKCLINWLRNRSIIQENLFD